MKSSAPYLDRRIGGRLLDAHNVRVHGAHVLVVREDECPGGVEAACDDVLAVLARKPVRLLCARDGGRGPKGTGELAWGESVRQADGQAGQTSSQMDRLPGHTQSRPALAVMQQPCDVTYHPIGDITDLHGDLLPQKLFVVRQLHHQRALERILKPPTHTHPGKHSKHARGPRDTARDE